MFICASVFAVNCVCGEGGRYVVLKIIPWEVRHSYLLKNFQKLKFRCYKLSIRSDHCAVCTKQHHKVYDNIIRLSNTIFFPCKLWLAKLSKDGSKIHNINCNYWLPSFSRQNILYHFKTIFHFILKLPKSLQQKNEQEHWLEIGKSK